MIPIAVLKIKKIGSMENMIRNPSTTGSWLLVISLAIFSIGAVIGFVAPSLREAPWSDDPQLALRAKAGNPSAHVLANSLILSSALVAALGLIAFTLEFKSTAQAWAVTGAVSFLLSAIFITLDRLISIKVITVIAQEGLASHSSAFTLFNSLQDGLSALFYYLGFLAITLIGIAYSQTPDSSGQGAALIIGGISGVALTLAGGVIPGMVFLGTGAIGIMALRSR